MLSELCVRRPVFATMLVMSLVVLGIFSFRDLGVDLFPRADPATVNVALSLPGASPDEISSSVIEPMEEAISGVSGIDELSARIGEGSGVITVRFVLERDLNDAANDVREKVAGAIKQVPPELLPPVITKVDPDADPVMSLMVSSDAMSLRTLTEIADKQVSRAIQTVNGVGQVTIAGTRAREIHIVVDVEKLNSYGLSIAQVRDAVVAENVEIPGGQVEQGKGQLLLRTLGRIDASEDFNNIVVATMNGTPIRVSDVGYAEDSFERPTSSVWYGEKPAVQLDIRRAMGENTVGVIEAVRARMPSIEKSLPKSVKLTWVRDDSKFIYASISSLEEHLIFGSLFAAIVVMFFIRNLRAVIISALAIPASIISTFTLMNIMGFTLNNMTLLGITLAVGIVIDDAIVVLENIFRYIEEKNCTPFEAAIQGTREVALAVMATTLSLVVIFLPIAFMNGYAKRFINPFGWTMAFSIMVSMLVSFTLTPMLSSRFLKLSDAVADHKTKEKGFFHWLDNWYSRQVAWAVDHSGVIIAVSAAVLLLTVPLNRMVGREFAPDEDLGEWTIHMDAPEGTSIDGSQEMAFKALKEISGIPGVANIEPIVNPGGSGVTGGGGGSNVTHVHFNVQALPLEERKVTQAQMIAEMRKRLSKFPAYRPSITSRNALGSGEGAGGYAISLNILSPDLQQLTEYSLKTLAEAQKTPSIAEPKLSLSVSNPELHVAVDRKRAADLGVRMQTIGNVLRLAVSGDDQISFYKEGQEQYPVKVRVLENQRRDAQEIGRLTVPSVTGPVRIDNIARVEAGLGPSALQRSQRQFTVQLNASVAPGHALDEASNDIRRIMADIGLPPTMSYRLQGQSKILDETTTNLILAIALAMIFVYMVLAAQFESFIQPIVIMLVLPISVPFALFTLWITHRTLNLWSALGMLLLLGIVKKNSILQVDYANVLRAKGVPLREAIIEACRTRLRPILMTTSAIIAGLIPTSLGLGIGGTGRAAIAITVIGGQGLCLFLTLLLVPVAYVKFDALEEAIVNKKFKAFIGRAHAATFGRMRPAPMAKG
ncbi:MAG TPA: efflux RND transporter permease subunit [Vicinamibacterales bacterium]|nr:efflux RND transporter permease subunit [Vicinamibacterales bacterium]